ncbi:hypothetical protein TSUD_148820 [Trifolium subterraneum]|uniref:Uncharacterized protein n=1 Tax=Trifolium subterraneum TaxID=3900 RepID=A0A2Z6MRB6_TRISU|nr:hypothetical protein TSUD_148820 [Trifolium subterraneum]
MEGRGMGREVREIASTPRVEDRVGLEEEMRSEKMKMREMKRGDEFMIDYGIGNVTEEEVV